LNDIQLPTKATDASMLLETDHYNSEILLIVTKIDLKDHISFPTYKASFAMTNIFVYIEEDFNPDVYLEV
jgi:hypothetical protein